MENLTQVLELLAEINEAGAINEKMRRVCSLMRRSRRRKVHCLSFGRCVTTANVHAEHKFPKMSKDVICLLMRSSRDWKRWHPACLLLNPVPPRGGSEKKHATNRQDAI